MWNIFWQFIHIVWLEVYEGLEVYEEVEWRESEGKIGDQSVDVRNVESVCVGGMLQQSIHLEFSSRLLVGCSARHKVKIRAFKTKGGVLYVFVCLLLPPQGNPAVASFFFLFGLSGSHQDLLVKHHFCIWLGKCTDPADLLCLLCLFSVCTLFFVFTSTQKLKKKILLLLPNIWYFLALVSTYLILKKKRPKSI